MGLSKVEGIKEESRYLRGTIAEELAQDTEKFSGDNTQLLKFHGTYQQHNRDARTPEEKKALAKFNIFMVRTAVPGGALTAEQYLAHDRLVDELGNGTLRITSRQGLQTHHVVKKDLQKAIQIINDCGASTKGACGDVVRNICATPVPLDTPPHRAVQELAQEFRKHFVAKSHAYTEIWLNGEKMAAPQEEPVEPIYGKHYLPRKFKIGMIVPPSNDIDIHSHDMGLVPHFPNGEVEGYTFLVGGGFGMNHTKDDTFPTLSIPLFYVPKDKAVAAAIAVITAQRDHGNREDRQHARLRYLIRERGIEWFRAEVESRLDFKPEDPKEFELGSVADRLGWHEQGDGKLFCCVYVQDGRIKDGEEGNYKSGFREIAETFGFPVRLTANCDILFHDIDPSQKQGVDEILARHRIPHADGFTEARKTCMACVALPTCGLALAESERALPGLMEAIDTVLRELDLQDEPLLIRMTGCPNGCARPYNADIAFVGRRMDEYAFFVGGSHRGDRMAKMYLHTVRLEDIPSEVRKLLVEFKESRNPAETFTDYWGRTHPGGEDPHPNQFHYDEREPAELAGSS
jgi:sulfite reductase beta subunit-like hemoprotein